MKTAVEWMVEKLFKPMDNPPIENVSDIIQQAKELEKQQIIESARYYFHERGKLTPEQYYIETYENE